MHLVSFAWQLERLGWGEVCIDTGCRVWQSVCGRPQCEIGSNLSQIIRFATLYFGRSTLRSQLATDPKSLLETLGWRDTLLTHFSTPELDFYR